MFQPYMNYGQGFGQSYPQNYQQNGQKFEIIRVNGRNGGEALAMSPNSEALLLDTTAPIVWLAQTDGAGYKTLTPYSIAPYQPEPEIDIRALNDRITRLEGLLDANESDTAKVSKSKSE